MDSTIECTSPNGFLSWTYNYGEYIWDETIVGEYGETMRNFLLTGDFSEEATRAAFDVYDKSNTKRRHQEMNMFLYGNYDSTH